MRLKKLVFTFLFSLIIFGSSKSQQTMPLEKVADSLYRFYYDENYFLVNKDCVYKAFERVIGLNVSDIKFHGKFKDFDMNGKAILEGTYVNGLKEGIFKAYHPNGALKWERNYKNDILDGHLRFYYPDGKPMLTLLFKEGDFFIQEFFDRKGKQQVIDGTGEYDMTMPVIGFTEHGYTAYNRTGKVVNGKPFGRWNINFINPSNPNKKIFFAYENFSEGFSIIERHIDEGYRYLEVPTSQFPLVPEDYFPRAEFFSYKNCTFDEYTGFSQYIANKFSNTLEKYDFINSTYGDNDLFENNSELEITYSVTVKSNGLPSNLKIENTSLKLEPKQRNYITNMAKQISYYLPSYLDNKPIPDKLNVTFKIIKQADEIFVPYTNIKREKGH